MTFGKTMMAGAAALGLAALGGSAWAQGSEFGPPELVAAAKKEGKLMLYSANVAENEVELIAAFNKRFPDIKVEFLRAPGSQLATRVKTEYAAGKLSADIIDISDRNLAKDFGDIFIEYAPPNAAKYPEASRASDRLWPRTTAAWCIAYNEALVKNPPKSWKDLLKPEYGKGQIGQVVAMSGGTTWTRAMFERQVLGESYWAELAKQNTLLSPSNAPLSDQLVRGEVSIAPLLTNVVIPKSKQGAPVQCSYGPEGMPITPFAAGITKTSQVPNAAKLFMNWSLSVEGQGVAVKDQGMFSSLEGAPVPDGVDAKAIKLWFPDPVQYEQLRAAWLDDWNKIFGYRQ